MNRMRTRHLFSLITIVVAACSVSPDASTDPGATASSTPGPTATAPTATMTPIPTPQPTVGVFAAYPSAIGAIPPFECIGDTTGGVIDYAANASGGDQNLEAAIRALRGVRWSDVIAVEGGRSAVIRDGGAIFTGSWFRSTSGGWLLSSFQACQDGGIAFMPPRGLVADAIAEVLADGAVTVRVGPSATAEAVAYDPPILARSDEVFIIDGPVRADGVDWYLVQALSEGRSAGPFGWVQAAGPDGRPWIDDIAESTCPKLPGDAGRLGVLPEELLVHCFGATELSFELEANVYCLGPDRRDFPLLDPDWFSPRCGALSGDACGSCDIPLAVDPTHGALPSEDPARWSFRGHFDDPVAPTCRLMAPSAMYTPSPEQVIHRCRTTFVLTSLQRLGDATG